MISTLYVATKSIAVETGYFKAWQRISITPNASTSKLYHCQGSSTIQSLLGIPYALHSSPLSCARPCAHQPTSARYMSTGGFDPKSSDTKCNDTIHYARKGILEGMAAALYHPQGICRGSYAIQFLGIILCNLRS